MTTDTVTRPTFAQISDDFGGDSIMTVAERIFGAGDAHGLTGVVSAGDALVFRLAAGNARVGRKFGEAGPFALTADQTARMFDALTTYALGPVGCDLDRDDHVKRVRIAVHASSCDCSACLPCECDRRNIAWRWASDVAALYGVEWI